MFDWRLEKTTLRATLNACIRQGYTYEQTEKALMAQFSASCNVCCLQPNMTKVGRMYCETGHKCYVELALEKYLEIAREKCTNERR